LICFSNGVFDLDTRIFRPKQDDDCITFSTEYNYNSEINHDIRQNIFTYLHEICPDTHKLIKMCASFLHGHKQNPKIWIIQGESRCGKSTFITFLKGTTGQYCQFFNTSKNMINSRNIPFIAALQGKRWVFFRDEEEKINTKQYNKLIEYAQPDHTFIAKFIAEKTQLITQQFEILLHTRTPIQKLKIPREYQDKFEIILFPYAFINIAGNEHIRFRMESKNNIKQNDCRCSLKMCCETYYQQFMLLILEEYYRNRP